MPNPLVQPPTVTTANGDPLGPTQPLHHTRKSTPKYDISHLVRRMLDKLKSPPTNFAIRLRVPIGCDTLYLSATLAPAPTIICKIMNEGLVPGLPSMSRHT